MVIDYPYVLNLQKLLAMVFAAGATDAVVAGGAVRDMLMSRPIKDIDVFYSGDIDQTKLTEFTAKDINPCAFDMEDVYEKNEEWEVTNPYLTCEFLDYPIQLIKCKDIASHVRETFGCDLSKVMVTQGGIGLTTEFIKDACLEMLSFTLDCKPSYVQKMEEKYPEFL